jgi:hypothetical protein
MVTGRDRVDSRAENFVGRRGCDTGAAGRIFAVGDHEVYAVLLAQLWHECFDSFTSGFSNDVADEKQFHFANSKISNDSRASAKELQLFGTTRK